MNSEITSKEGLYMFLFLLLYNHGVVGQDDELIHHVAPISALHHLVVGEVLPCCGEKYQRRRMVNNRACLARPAVIVRPRTTEDVATTVNFARRNRLQISVRSGGHGYTCNNLQDGGIHIDMRGMRAVKLVRTQKSPTGVAASLGSGATWGMVQRAIPTTKFSYPHGQCRSVGVGGYLLGGGVNWLGTYNKYGYGAEHVLQLRVVTANGTILDISPGKTTIHPKYAHEEKSFILTDDHNDLFFAMRGAGSSFGIATDFLYQVYPTPETSPAVVLVWITGKQDLRRIQRAAFDTNKYSITVNNEFAGDFWNSFKTRIVYKFLPTLLTSVKILHREGATPLFLTLTDIRPGAGELTDPVPAMQYLLSKGVDLVYRVPALVRILDKLARYLYEMNIDEQEFQPPGDYNLAGVNLGGMKDTLALEQVFFNNNAFGVKRRNNQMFRTMGCDYCFWTIHFRNRQKIISKDNPKLKISTNTDDNLKQGVDSNLVCLFKDKKSECPLEIIKIKKSMEHKLEKYKQPYSKYYNYPSCDSKDWMFRYWGDNYSRLLTIKAYWDPENVFQHCQSVGSTDNMCCPFTLKNPQGTRSRGDNGTEEEDII